MPAPKKTPAKTPAPDPRAALIDDYVPLARLVEEFRPTQKLYEASRKEILSWTEKLPADQAITFRGTTGQVTVGPREKKRSIKSMAAIAKFFGARFFELCTFALEHIDSEMNAAERAKYVVESQSGNRKITAGPKLP